MNKVSNLRFALCACLLAGLFWPYPAGAQPPQPLPQVQVQTKAGFRVRITHAAWVAFDESAPGRARATGKRLMMRFASERDTDAYTGELYQRTGLIEARGPHGEPVKINHDYYSQTVVFSDVNPNWKTLGLKFSLADPGIGENNSGTYSNSLEFDNVPLPAQAGQTIEMQRELEGHFGTRVILQSATLEKTSDGKSFYRFKLDFQAPTRYPDLLFVPPYGLSIWQYDRETGEKKRPPKGAHRPLRPQDSSPFHPRLRQVWDYSIDREMINPDGLLNKIHLAFSLRETVASQRKMAAYHFFNFELPLQELADNAPAFKIPAVTTVRGNGVELTVEDVSFNQIPAVQPPVLRLWTRTLDARATTGWAVQSVHSIRVPSPHNSKPRELDLFTLPYRAWRSGWRANNQKAAANAHSATFSHLLPTSPGAAGSKWELQVELAEAGHAAYSLELKNLPRPGSGQTLQINRTARDSSGAEFTVQAIAEFSDARSPDGWPAWDAIKPPTPTGIALRCLWKPAGGARTQIASHLFQAHDDVGRGLLDDSLHFTLLTEGADRKWELERRPLVKATVAPQEAYEFTLYLLPPAAETKNFNVQLSTEEIIPTGQKQTVKVPLEP